MYRWSSAAPIYQQVSDHLVMSLLEGAAGDGARLPSVRELSRTYMVNPLTVTRALEGLRNRGWIETRPGIGNFLRAGASIEMLDHGRKHFLDDEWPALRRRLIRLGISASDMQ